MIAILVASEEFSGQEIERIKEQMKEDPLYEPPSGFYARKIELEGKGRR